MIKLGDIVKELLIEGGNVFGDTSPIKKEYMKYINLKTPI